MPLHANPAMLVLEDGRTFRGESFGAEGETFGEAVFSTGMSGYQETLTDPSYHRQVVVMTAPHVGNTGMNDEDPESGQIWVAGYVVRDPARVPSQLALATHPRRRAARAGRRRHQRGRHPRPDPPPPRARRHARRHLHHRDRPAGAARAGARLGRDDRCRAGRRGHHRRALRRARRSGRKRFTVAALDLGIKTNTPRMMSRARHRGARAARGARPSRTSSPSQPDGVFYSNGPGRPGDRGPERRGAAGGARPRRARTSASASATSSSDARWASAPTS